MIHMGMAHSDEDVETVLLDELERLADELGETPSAPEMNEMGEFCVMTYANRFGSWNEALEEAGLPLNQEEGGSRV